MTDMAQGRVISAVRPTLDFRIEAGYRDVVQRVERLQHTGKKKKKP